MLIDGNDQPAVGFVGTGEAPNREQATTANDDRLHGCPGLDLVTVSFAPREILIERRGAQIVPRLGRHPVSAPPKRLTRLPPRPRRGRSAARRRDGVQPRARPSLPASARVSRGAPVPVLA